MAQFLLAVILSSSFKVVLKETYFGRVGPTEVSFYCFYYLEKEIKIWKVVSWIGLLHDTRPECSKDQQ